MDGNLPFLTNLDYGTTTGENNRIFYGGDFAPRSGPNAAAATYSHGFQVWKDLGGVANQVDQGETKARGNNHASRLTLGGTEKWYSRFASEPLFGDLTSAVSYITNLGWLSSSVAPINSFDPDDLGADVDTWLCYTGCAGFIAINEEDSLVIRLTGYVDPNNRMKYSTDPSLGSGNSLYGGTLLESEEYVFDIAHPNNDGQNGVRFGVVPSTLPQGATFNSNLFVWTPNFIQGDGTSDNSQRNGWYFVDANIANGSTTSQATTSVTLDSTHLTAPTTTLVGHGKGELRDSLYVVYFSAQDDGIPPKVGTDSLFIMINDSIANPPPVFTQRKVVNRLGQEKTYLNSSVQFTTDSLLNYYEGDSLVITFYAADQDSARGEVNDDLEFLVHDWSDFLHRTSSHSDSLALDTTSILVDDTPTALRVRLRLAYNVGDTTDVADTLIVKVSDGTSSTYDTMLFRLHNVNRKPIWDQDTSSKPSDSALVWVYSPETVEADSIQAFYPLAVSNNATDSIFFQQYVYDPDSLIGDNLGPVIAITQSGAPVDLFNSAGLMIVTISETDTASTHFTITATDNDGENPQAASKDLVLRVAPEPIIDEIYPLTAAPGETITIFGSGFGLYDDDVTPPSRVRFRARNESGQAQNLVAVINSWSRDRINLIIPENTPVSQYDPITFDYVLDTIEVNSSVFTTPNYYPYLIEERDSTRITDLELSNLTPTSAVIKWKTAFTGIDSVIVATDEDTLDITSTHTWRQAPGTVGGYWPTFVLKDAGTMSQTKSTVQIFTGATTNTDQVHLVKLTDLAPNTKYRFIIGMSDTKFYGDTSKNQNGPWRPTKIDRHTTGDPVYIRGFFLRTPPTQGANGETFEITGKVYTTTGSATNALVTVKIVDYENVEDTSMALVTTVASDSTWEINLGMALKDTLNVQNRVFPHKEGDYLIITVRGDGDEGFTKFVATRGPAGSSPQVVSNSAQGIQILPSVSYDIRLRVGLNLMGVPVSTIEGEIASAEDLLTALGGGKPAITKYNSTYGIQETIIRAVSASGRQFVGAEDFDLELYDAYFVSVDVKDYLNFEGRVFGDTLPVKLFPSGALYWISRPAQQSTLFYSWSARSMLANIPFATEIFRFDEYDQQYDNAIMVVTSVPEEYQFVGTDFHIDVSEGYILRVTNASQWDIDIPTSTLLANADQTFSGSTTDAPSITLNTENSLVPGNGAVRSIRLTDVTSSAARISWVTDVAGSAQVRYGKAEEGLTHVAAVSRGQLAQGMYMVQLLGLEPETEYVYEVVCNGVTYNNSGQPFTLVTSKIGIGYPYSVYGRLVDESGKSLDRTLVYVEAKRGDTRSAPLAAVTDDRGYWNVNLANLKTAEGLVYEWSAGDELRVTAIYRDASLTFRTLVTGESPQNIIRVDDTGTGTASKNEVSRVSLPKAFALGQNFPNPFNPSTTIAFDIPDTREEGVSVELNVYNIRGQLVRSLVNDVKKPGHYAIQWNGLNENGEVVSSGVYFYRIKAGEFTSTRKMVLLK
ncbi:MAG: fibronectin type III domain-containing protein [Candidatus Glassbacteria bacterium]|nr:fibronectin type III domain-containing protein [Candidatus Glassbacteria bacterium]